ncbi:MAG: AAA family ATPase [Christensenellaceae bacterium]|nr:AAA family ATPase [Christensenellaceae bacterium]
MYYISKVEIQRFRSILDMKFDISDCDMPIAICGQNNVGKTNTLRAINLFFNPESFNRQEDIPVVKKATRGGSYYPAITLTFTSSNGPNISYELTRDFKIYDAKHSGLTGKKRIENGGKSSESTLEDQEINNFINSIEFRFIRSIDVNIPELINDLTSDILDTKYQKSRFANKKKELKDAYDKYSSGMQEILDSFSEDVSEVFHSFKENWDIKFTVPSQIDRFRDMISDDVELNIDDKSGLGVTNKGSGLQRLAIILLNLEILKRIDKNKKSTFIVCIDEPDIYLHDGLQKKLYNFIKECNFQVFYTTHSKKFIDENNLSNIVFLEALENSQYYVRAKGDVEYIKTICTPLNDENGYRRICEHLGIEPVSIAEPGLQEYNILVEGECDEKYLSKLADYFGINHSKVKIIFAGGVTKINAMLGVYNTFYRNQENIKPTIHVLFDDDSAGRKEYNELNGKIEKTAYKNINVKLFKIKNYNGKSSNDGNYEIEDLMYPEIICHIANKFLRKEGMNVIKSNDVLYDIAQPRYIPNGILNVCDIRIGLVNTGNSLSPQMPAVKRQMCELFDIADSKTRNLLDQARVNHPAVEGFVKEIFNFK